MTMMTRWQMIAAALSRASAKVNSALSFDQAITSIKESPPDVIVSDIAMPGHDGYELISKLTGAESGAFHSRNSDHRYAREEDRRRALASGFQAYLPKPIELAELITTVAKLAGVADKAPENGKAGILQGLNNYSRESEMKI